MNELIHAISQDHDLLKGFLIISALLIGGVIIGVFTLVYEWMERKK